MVNFIIKRIKLSNKLINLDKKINNCLFKKLREILIFKSIIILVLKKKILNGIKIKNTLIRLIKGYICRLKKNYIQIDKKVQNVELNFVIKQKKINFKKNKVMNI